MCEQLEVLEIYLGYHAATEYKDFKFCPYCGKSLEVFRKEY